MQVTLRNKLSARALKQYRETAKAVARAPWHLLKAQAFLESMCDLNEKDLPHPRELHFKLLWHYKVVEVQRSVDWKLPQNVLVPTPRHIEVSVPGPGERANRLKRKRSLQARAPQLAAIDEGHPAEPLVADSIDGDEIASSADTLVLGTGPHNLSTPPEPVRGPIRRRPAGQPGVNGCSKCRWSLGGCGKCRAQT